MRQTRVNRKMTLRELSQLTGISLSRLSDLESHREVPSSAEVDTLGMILGTGIKFADSESIKKNKSDFENTVAVVLAVHKEADRLGLKKGHGGSGIMSCPKCKGELRFQVSGYNGHIWGICATENCIQWME